MALPLPRPLRHPPADRGNHPPRAARPVPRPLRDPLGRGGGRPPPAPADSLRAPPFWRDPRLAAVLLAVGVVLPFVGYHLARRWMEGDAPRLPRHRAGVPRRSGDSRTERDPARRHAALPRHRARARSRPQGPHPVGRRQVRRRPPADAPRRPLYWYANRDAIFLCVTEVSLVGQIGRTLSPPPSRRPPSAAAGRLSKTIAVPGGDTGQFLAPAPAPRRS